MKCVQDVFPFTGLEGSDPVEAQGWLLGSGPEVQRIISASHCVWSWTSEVATKLCGSLYCEDTVLNRSLTTISLSVNVRLVCKVIH